MGVFVSVHAFFFSFSQELSAPLSDDVVLVFFFVVLRGISLSCSTSSTTVYTEYALKYIYICIHNERETAQPQNSDFVVSSSYFCFFWPSLPVASVH